jgi:hypothetical protein
LGADRHFHQHFLMIFDYVDYTPRGAFCQYGFDDFSREFAQDRVGFGDRRVGG